MIHYFAYGSNLHPLRLTDRVHCADLVGSVELASHQLAFHKQEMVPASAILSVQAVNRIRYMVSYTSWSTVAAPYWIVTKEKVSVTSITRLN